MDGEAEPTMRLHLHVPTAIQGELFPTSDAPRTRSPSHGAIVVRSRQKWRVSRTASLTIGRVNR